MFSYYNRENPSLKWIEKVTLVNFIRNKIEFIHDRQRPFYFNMNKRVVLIIFHWDFHAYLSKLSEKSCYLASSKSRAKVLKFYILRKVRVVADLIIPNFKVFSINIMKGPHFFFFFFLIGVRWLKKRAQVWNFSRINQKSFINSFKLWQEIVLFDKKKAEQKKMGMLALGSESPDGVDFFTVLQKKSATQSMPLTRKRGGGERRR